MFVIAKVESRDDGSHKFESR